MGACLRHMALRAHVRIRFATQPAKVKMTRFRTGSIRMRFQSYDKTGSTSKYMCDNMLARPSLITLCKHARISKPCMEHRCKSTQV